MEVRRIDPSKGFLNEIRNINRKVIALETKPSGNIVIRETLSTEDPETGVKTIIGELPDGSIGFQPFVGDITPPPVATTPIVSAEPGAFAISWDGQFVAGAEKPTDFEHLRVLGCEVIDDIPGSYTVVGVIRNISDQVHVLTDIATSGELWQFSFVSEDYNGNLSDHSGSSQPLAMVSILSTEDQAWTELKDQIEEAKQAATDSQIAAGQAQTNANAAAASALEAVGVAAGKGKVLFGSDEPASADRVATALWIDTTNNSNTPKRWNGSAWIAVTDKTALNAATAAANAETVASQAFNAASSAATAAGQAQSSANGKNRNWYQNIEPAGTDHKDGDVWFNTGNGNKIYVWKSNSWVLSQDEAISGPQLLVNSINAGHLSAGSVTTPALASKSITADKLVISSTDNLLMEADFSNKGYSWQLTASTVTIQATAGRGSTPAIQFTGSIDALTSVNLNNKVPVGSDDRFRASIFYKSTAAIVAGAVSLKLRCYTTATAFTIVTVATNPAETTFNVWKQLSGISPVLPANTIAVEFLLEVKNSATTVQTVIDYVSVTKAFTGALIVDGAIDGQTITGATVRTSSVMGQVYGKMGPSTVQPPGEEGIFYTGIGFNVNKIIDPEDPSHDAGMYSKTGTDLILTQGGGNTQMAKISLEKHGIATYSYAATKITSRSSIILESEYVGGITSRGQFTKLDTQYPLMRYSEEVNWRRIPAGFVGKWTTAAAVNLVRAQSNVLNFSLKGADQSTVLLLYRVHAHPTAPNTYGTFQMFANGVLIQDNTHLFSGTNYGQTFEATISYTFTSSSSVSFSLRGHEAAGGGQIRMGAGNCSVMALDMGGIDNTWPSA